MAHHKRNAGRSEFGDFQTPSVLAHQVCDLLSRQGVKPASILEPTCGEGNLLFASLDRFPTARQAIGAEINPEYVARVDSRLQTFPYRNKTRLIRADFFSADWAPILKGLDDPILVVGNPPWVTSADLGALGSSNLPPKSNFQNHSGLEALTGKSNFDISEWMLIRTLELLNGRSATLAMLCKLAVARKVLLHGWKSQVSISDTHIYPFDAAEHFGASVEACLLVCVLTPSGRSAECSVHRSIEDHAVESVLGLRDGRIVAHVTAYERWKHFLAKDELYKWRSGIKHDCSKVMEFRREGSLFRNGLGEVVELEEAYMYPMLKSSDLTNGRCPELGRWMLVTQRHVGESTTAIRQLAPRTWNYLLAHSRLLDGRASSIYKRRPRFSIFGVGEYSFAPWKVAISGFYKKLNFKVVGRFQGKPIMLDDTCYFIASRDEAEAEYIASLLNSDPAQAFYNSVIFWDAKRPITVELLAQLDLGAVSRELGSWETLNRILAQRETCAEDARTTNLPLFG